MNIKGKKTRNSSCSCIILSSSSLFNDGGKEFRNFFNKPKFSPFTQDMVNIGQMLKRKNDST
jgi:hypothetical protein